MGKQKEEISEEVHQAYSDCFDSDLYDPKVWAQAATGPGMLYFVVTSERHDGFCLWGSHLTNYKVTNTPYGYDLLARWRTRFVRRTCGGGASNVL